MIEYSDVRYLLAKRPLDDRALNRHVVDALRRLLAARRGGEQRLNVLEIGAGVGTMVCRLREWDVLDGVDYTLVDTDRTSLAAAESTLKRWASRAELEADGALCLTGPAGVGGQVRLRFRHADALELCAAPEHQQRYDLVVANAVLDLMEQEPALRRIWRALKPNALFWFTINFDGETIFLPERPLDELVMRLYHRTMDERLRDGVPSGDSHSGRHLLELVPKTGGLLAAAGSSDWVVFPSITPGTHEQPGYAGDEAYFLHHIVNFVATALRGHPELDAARFQDWVAERHAQVDAGQLIYIAHQLDIVGQGPAHQAG